jgi:hypothetical protein
MANPIRLFLVPNVGLEFDFKKPHDTNNPNCTSAQDPIRYTLTNLQHGGFSELLKAPIGDTLEVRVQNHERGDNWIELSKDTVNYDLQGWMSPISDVTLPPVIKKLVGIQPLAKYYAYIHPPEGLAEMIDWTKVDFKEDPDLNDLMAVNKWAMPFCCAMGAYAYFDKDHTLIQVNALSLLATQYTLDFAGPFQVSDEATAEMRELQRVHPLSMNVFYESFFVALGVTCPMEMFRSKNITQQGNKGMHGSFIFYRDNGSALAYAVDNSGFIDPTGSISSIQDAFESITLHTKNGKDQSLSFVTNYHLPPFGREEWRKKKFQRGIVTAEDLKELGITDPDTLIHEACRAQCDKEAIDKLLDRDKNPQRLLKHADTLLWLPLHYACRYCQTDAVLISSLIERYPKAVTKPDRFNRCPLHIAIDSCASVEVIDLLLKKDRSGKAMEAATKTLKRNPFHIACNRGVE